MLEITEVLQLPLATGAVVANIPPTVLEQLNSQVGFILRNKKLAGKVASYTHPVGGQISQQINFVTQSSFNDFLKELLISYQHYYKLEQLPNIKNHISWLNLQKKFEYNPNHNHNGDISYVVWLKVPYSLKNEDVVENTINSSIKANGRFSFSFVKKNLEVGFKMLDVDNEYEGKIMMFPSSLVHCVYPFYTSDDYRISLSGNIWIYE